MAKKENTALAVVGNTVPDALKALKEELKGLKLISETQYKTGSDGKVTGFQTAIQNETSVETLIKMHSSVSGREKAYNASQARLSEVAGGPITAPPFKDNGASLESIESDIALRIKVLNITDRKAVLEGLLKEAETFLTEKDKFAMFQRRMAETLGLKAPDAETTEDAVVVVED